MAPVTACQEFHFSGDEAGVNAPSDEVAMGDEGEAVVESTPSFPVETTKWLMGPSLHWGLLRANTM